MHVEVDQCRLETFMAEEIFDSEEVGASFQQMGGKTMAEGMNCGGLLYTGFFLARRKARWIASTPIG